MARKREFTNWVFARELRDSKVLEERPGDERAKPYVVTPLGTRIRRVLLSGMVTQKNSEETMTKVTVSDGTGNFYLSAFNNEFGMRAKAMMDSLEINDPVVVMGRVNSFQNEEKIYFNINPEMTVRTDQLSLEYWRMKALHIARRKIYAIRAAAKLENPSAKDVVPSGYSEAEAESALRAISSYPDYDLQDFDSAISSRLQPASSDADSTIRKFILDYIKANDTDGKGCRYEDLLAAAQNATASQDDMDRMLNQLGSDGEIFEVSLKRYKVI